MDTQIERIRQLGGGAFGTVWLIRDTVDQQEYALKIIEIAGGSEDATLREVRVLSKLDKQHIVRYYHSWLSGGIAVCAKTVDGGASGSVESESTTSSRSSDCVVFEGENSPVSNIVKSSDHSGDPGDADSGAPTSSGSSVSNESLPFQLLHIKMELCDLSLRNWIDTMNPKVPFQTILNVFFQLAVAVKYIHLREGLIHRDLKPENILLKLRNNQPPQVKIGDFGLVSLPGARTTTGATRRTGSMGTYPYAPPEMCPPANAPPAEVKYDSKVDVHAMGVIFMELVFPIKTKQELYKVCEEIRDTRAFPKTVGQIQEHKEEKQKIVEMMEPDPEFRPTSKKIHIWIKSYQKTPNKCNCHIYK